MEFLIYATTILIVLVCKKFYKRILTSYTLIILPYVVILFLNNHIAVNFGFYTINHNTQAMILAGSFFFFIGVVIMMGITQKRGHRVRANTKDKFDEKRALPYIWFVIAVRTVEIFIKFRRYGLSGIIRNDFALLISRGFVSHLILSIFPMMMIVFYLWTQDKKNRKSYLLAFLIFTILAFVETEKAQIISLVITVFLFCGLKDRKTIRKGMIILFASIAVFFISNYVIKLTLQGYASYIANEYYTYRLWNYVAGGLINSNLITNPSANIVTNAFHYLWEVVCAFPDMILGRVAGVSLHTSVKSLMPYINDFPAVTSNLARYKYQTGNVVSVMTLMWGNGNILAFGPVCIIWGAVSEWVYAKMHNVRNDFTMMTCCCYMAFSTLSFFGSFYSSPAFVERLIMCYLISRIFNKRYRFRIRSRNKGMGSAQKIELPEK